MEIFTIMAEALAKAANSKSRKGVLFTIQRLDIQYNNNTDEYKARVTIGTDGFENQMVFDINDNGSVERVK